uniref:Ionotropic glutamate receptor C-terminal domain-containing protein n=1 Tax=Hemiselmis tepida TaxID=464990 RepID=A0A7S0W1Q3_9CRYP
MTGHGLRSAAAAILTVCACVSLFHGASAQRTRGGSMARRHSAVVSSNPIPDTLYQQLQMLETRRAAAPTSFKCSNCPLEADGRPMAVRIMFMDVAPANMNPAARAAATKLGRDYSCDDPKLAVPECFVWSNWVEGWVGEFTNTFLKELNMNVTALTRANFSKEVYEVYKGGSSYTRCVWEVRLGNVDLCSGDFWETEERRGIAPFASAMDSDVLKLGTLSLGASTAIRLDSIFDPFTPDVWAVNLCMIFVSAMCIWLVETTTEMNGDFEDQLEPHKRLTWYQGMSKALWMGMMGYVSGGAANTTTTWPGRFILLGFGWFVYISVSSYTANLASFMISQSSAIGLIDAYGDISDRAGNLCLLEAIEGMVKTPGVGKVAYDDYIPAIEGLYAGKCLGVQVGRNEWKTIVRGGRGQGSICVDPADTKGHSSCPDPDGQVKKILISGCKCKDPAIADAAECPKDCPDHRKYCSLLEINDEAFAFYMNFALPVSKRIQDYVSAWIISLRQEGTVQRLKGKWIDAVTPDVCGGGAMEESESQSLGIKAMAGTFVISGAFMVVGLVWHAATLCMGPKRGADRAPRGMFDEAAPKGVEGEFVETEFVDGEKRSARPLSQKTPDDVWGGKGAEMSTAQYDDICGKLSEHQKAITQQGRVLERTERLLAQQEGQLEQILSLLSDMPSAAPAPRKAKAAKAPNGATVAGASLGGAYPSIESPPLESFSGSPTGGASPKRSSAEDLASSKHAIGAINERFPAANSNASGEQTPGAQNPILGFFQQAFPPPK